MIVDHLTRAARYTSLHPRLSLALAYLRRAPADLSEGRHVIEGESVYANVMAYETRTPADFTHEVHRSYADVQFLVSGEERLRFTPAERLGSGEGYIAEKDYELFRTPVEPSELVLRAGQFAIFFPGEGHQPGLLWHVAAPVRKIVVKVRLAEAAAAER